MNKIKTYSSTSSEAAPWKNAGNQTATVPTSLDMCNSSA